MEHSIRAVETNMDGVGYHNWVRELMFAYSEGSGCKSWTY